MLHCGHCQGDQEDMVVANFRSSLNFRLTFSSNFTQAGWNLEKFQEDLNIDDLSPSIDYELLTQDVSLVIG